MNYLRYVMKKYLFVVLALVFVIVYWSSAGKLPPQSVVFPKFITAILIPLFIWVIIQSIVEYRALAKNTEVPENEKWKFSLNITRNKLVIVGATVVYVAIIPVIGYIVTTVLYVGGLSFFLGNRKPVKLILYTGILVAILYLIFGFWLRIRLPTGILI